MPEQLTTSGGPSIYPLILALREISGQKSARHTSRLQALLKTLPPLQMTFDRLSSPHFALFPDLPPELRNRIWRLVTSQPRIIKLVPYNIRESARVKGQPQHPPLLHTCREARSVGRSIYTKCLQNCCDTRFPCQETPCTRPRNIIYVNFDVDRFLYGAYEPHSGMACDFAPSGERRELRDFNIRPKDLRLLQWLEVELYGQKPPNPISVARRLRPFWELGVLKEYVLKLKRYDGMVDDSLNQELGDKLFINYLREYSKRFWGHKVDLAPAPPHAAS